MAITTGQPMSRRDELTSQYRQQMNPQAPPTQSPAPQGGGGQSGGGSFYGGMSGSSSGSSGNSFYGGLGGGMSRPSQTRMSAPPAPVGGLWEGPQNPQPATPVGQFPGGPGAGSAPAPTAPPQHPPVTYGWGNGTQPADAQSAYQQAFQQWQAQRAQAQARGEMVNMTEFPQFDQWAQQNGWSPGRTQGSGSAPAPTMPPLPNNSPPIMGGPQQPRGGLGDPEFPGSQQPQPTQNTMPSQSFPTPMERALPPETTTYAPPSPQPTGKDGDASRAPRQGSQPQQPAEYRSVYDRPSFNYTPPAPQYSRHVDVDYGASQRTYHPGQGSGSTDFANRSPDPRMQDIANRARRQAIPTFAFGTDNSAQYQAQGMGNSWIPSSQNSYTQGRQLPPAIQRLVDMGMPIPPALLNSVTGGQSGPLNMASAFTARGGGSLPSLQGLDQMSQDERGAFSGYLTGPIGMPEQSTVDSIGRPTSNLQGAARSRM